MMAGQFKEYNWRDIQRLIYADVGLKTDEEQRTRGELWHIDGFAPPEHERDTCVRVQTYDKPYSERIEDHAGES